MGISPNLLGEGEHVIISTRTHWKALVVPVLWLLLTCAISGFVIAVLPSGGTHDTLVVVVIVIALVAVIWLTIRRVLTWLASSYTVTNRRLINRSGVFTRRGRDIPLHRINDVKYERGLLDRLLGCGTLIISDASDEGRSVLPDVPNVENLQLIITDLLFSKHDGSEDDGTPPHPLEPQR